MNAQRPSVKLFTVAGARLAPDEARRLLHGFIQEPVLDEVMIDVADYSHVHEGPGVLLICHHANYALDEEAGRPGLTYLRKRDAAGSFGERLDAAVRRALVAGRLVEERSTLRFSRAELLVRLNDRLLAPNVAATFATVKPELAALADRLYPTGNTLAHLADPKAVFGVRITATEEAEDLATLLARLD